MYYVFTLGFHADHAIRRLSRARDVEAIIVVTARPVVRAVQNAFLEISAFCEKARYPVPTLIDVPLDDAASAVHTVVRAVRGARHVVADLSGGMRIVTVLTLVAMIAISRYSYVEVYVSGEREDAPEVRIPILALYALALGGLSGDKLAILELLEKYETLSVSDLARLLGRSERTVRAHLAELRRYELVEGSDRVSISSWGKLLIALSREA